jgi:hypothetical protein
VEGLQDDQPTIERPVPDLTPRSITVDLYEPLTPKKLELLDGYIIGPPDWPECSEERRNLLSLLMVNEGLLEVVRLAPPELWRTALQQVYGDS